MKAFRLLIVAWFTLILLCAAMQTRAQSPVLRCGDCKGNYVQVSIPALHELTPHDSLPTEFALDFEQTPDFSLTFGDWSVIDGDGHGTYGITGYTFPHQAGPMAFMAFNPASTTPSMAGVAGIQPHGGNRFGACFSSNPPANNDWFISPRLQMTTDGSFSFWIKSMTDQYGLDSYTVSVSTTDKDTASFAVISGPQPLKSTTTWTKKVFNLSAYNGQLVYVAIHCISNDNFLLMIDDLLLKSSSEGGLTADFTADTTGIRVGGTVDFSDQSTGGATTWQWSFPGGFPATSAEQNPSGIRYTAAGTYPVSLKIGNGFLTDSITKSGFITVSGYPVTLHLDFEALADFTTNFSPWTLVDVRGGNTYGINQPNGVPYYFPHVNEPMAYICFNPLQTTPPINNLKPHAGLKLGCSFSTYPPMNPNDKWLISPRMSLGTAAKIEFWVMSFNNLYGDEKYNVMVSVTDNQPASFVAVNPSPETAPAVWTQRSYNLSAFANRDVYVAVQCVTDNSFIFMIDDIYISSSLATGEIPGAPSVHISPNPAGNVASLIFPADTGPLHLLLSDAAGRIVADRDETPENGLIRLDVSGFPNGLYLLRADGKGMQFREKLSVLH